MKNFFLLLQPLLSPFRSTRTRNYRGILSLTYRWGTEDRAGKQGNKAARLRRQMLELVASQKKTQIRERIQILSDHFLNPSNHGTPQ